MVKSGRCNSRVIGVTDHRWNDLSCLDEVYKLKYLVL